MNHWLKLSLTLAILILAVMSWPLVGESRKSDRSDSREVMAQRATDSSLPSPVKTFTPYEVPTSSAPTVVLKTIRSVAIQRLDPYVAISSIGDLISKAQAGDSASQMLIFDVANWCVSQRSSLVDFQIAEMYGAKVPANRVNPLREARLRCEDIPQEHADLRFHYLMRAAAAGSAEAQIQFADALALLPRHDPSWIWIHADEVPVMREQALQFLERAAASGYVEAISRLADTYKTGRFGMKDEERARRLAKLVADSNPATISGPGPLAASKSTK